jgi:glutamyl-tRNA synthetase
VAPTAFDEKAKQKYWHPETPALMKMLAAVLETVEPFTKENIEHAVQAWITSNNLNMGAVMNAFRLCIVGGSKGPSMFEMAALLKKEEILRRIKSVI